MDGRKVGTIESGGKLLLTMAPGRHRLQLRFAYITSRPLDVDVADGERKDLRVARAYGFGPWDVRYLTRRRSAIAVEPGRGDA